METYRYHPPHIRATQVPYQEILPGDVDCQQKLAEEAWVDRILVQDGIVFVTYSCRYSGRRVCQSLKQVLSPAAWKGESA